MKPRAPLTLMFSHDPLQPVRPALSVCMGLLSVTVDCFDFPESNSSEIMHYRTLSVASFAQPRFEIYQGLYIAE